MVKKKKVLFIIGTLQSGGVSKSMVNLLNSWDLEKYDTSLLLCCKSGDVFSRYLPKSLKILYDERLECASGGVGDLLKVFCFRSSVWWRIKLFFGILLRLVISRVSRAMAGRMIAKMMPVISDEEYDLIVDYGGQQLLYYMVDKLKGKKKVTFFHNDYSKWPYYYKADKKYYPKVDHIFSISQVCVDALKCYFPDCADKISIMENIVSPSVVRQQAKAPIDDETAKIINEHDVPVIVTVAHICRRKGSDLAVDAAKILREKGIRFTWLFVGKVLDNDLAGYFKPQDNLYLVGIKSNPYPYMRVANIYVQPSRFEGKSISLDEAKILCKPIVVTNFSTVNDQFTDGVNGSICNMDADDLALKLEELISNKNLRDKYTSFLSHHIVDNSSEVSKLTSLID